MSDPSQQQVAESAAAIATAPDNTSDQQLAAAVAHGGGGALEDHNSEHQQQQEGEAAAAAIDPNRKTQRRYCRFPGCTRVIKSQGHCQRHGAKTKRCRVEGCDKQAQGTHDGMCKRHWKAIHFPEEMAAHRYKGGPAPPPPEGESVYDSVLPQSIAFRPAASATGAAADSSLSSSSQTASGGKKPAAAMTNESMTEDMDLPPGVTVMPLVAFLRKGRSKDLGWHRNEERRARGIFPVSSLSAQLEPWERQLALVEILLLSGGTPYANFRDLSYAWGRDKGFHHVLANSVCERRGEVERKRRKDAGEKKAAAMLSPEELQAYRQSSNKKQKTAAASVAAGQQQQQHPSCRPVQKAAPSRANEEKDFEAV